jgi:putative NADPH-quinone reductase
MSSLSNASGSATLTEPAGSRTPNLPGLSREWYVRVLVIYCHPVAESFAAAAHATVLEALAAGGHAVTDVDLYAEGFDPVMSRQDRLDYQNTARNVRPVRKYDEQLATAEAIVLVYPAWWYGMPAMLKGYFDRVWLPGVAFDVAPDGQVLTDRLKQIRRIVVVTTYGASWWMVRVLLGDPARKLVSRAIRALCARNCRVDWYVQYDMDRATPQRLRRFLDRVRIGIGRL